MMRSFLLVVVGIFLLSSQASALIRVGIKGGVNLASVTLSRDTLDFERTPGFIGGLSGEVALAPALAVRTDVLYAQKSAKFSYEDALGVAHDGKLLLDEVVVAPFLVLRYPLPRLMPFLQVGPEVGWNTLAKAESGGQEQTIGQVWRNNSFSLNMGAGVLIPVGPSDITLDFRYNLGLIDLHSETRDVKTKTNGIQIFAGYNFFKI